VSRSHAIRSRPRCLPRGKGLAANKIDREKFSARAQTPWPLLARVFENAQRYCPAGWKCEETGMYAAFGVPCWFVPTT
jgi:hypothetical protein